MHRRPYSEELITCQDVLILHEHDWKKRLGRDVFESFVEKGALIKPILEELDGQQLVYHNGYISYEVEVIIEDGGAVIDPIDSKFEVEFKREHVLKFFKYNTQTAQDYITQINNLSISSFKLVNNDYVYLLGEVKLRSKSYVVLYATVKNVGNQIVEQVAQEGALKQVAGVVLLSRFEPELRQEGGIMYVPYYDFQLIPISSFKFDSDSLPTCATLNSHFKYPLVVDTHGQHIYVFGERITGKKGTNLYRFVWALSQSYPSLPMDTEAFFNMHDITTEHYESAVKELRSQIKDKVKSSRLNEKFKEQALRFFDLIAGEKTRGAVDLKINANDIHIW